MDVIALAQHGILRAVATLGTATSTYHIQLLAKHTQHIIFCFDGDAAGKQAAWRGLESTLAHLNGGLEAGFVFLPDGHDPDSLVRAEGKEQFEQRLKQATPLPQFLFDTLSQNINLVSTAGKTQLIQLAKPLLQKLAEGSYKQLLIDDLARLTHIESHRLYGLIDDKIPAKPVDNTIAIARTPERVAVALLIQNPDIYSSCVEKIDVSLLHDEDHQLLIKLLSQLQKQPTATTASLIEAWRNSSYFDFLNQLAAWDHQVPEEELTKEFIDIMLFLQKKNSELVIRQYINKSRREGLSEAERNHLQQMLKERHQPAEIK